MPVDLVTRFGGLVPAYADRVSLSAGALRCAVDPSELADVAATLHASGFTFLEMVTAVDEVEAIRMVYVIVAPQAGLSLTVECTLPGYEPAVSSVTSIWPAALWQEREVFDLFGVDFEGHPDLRRILLPDGFEGHPLRKSYDDPRLIRRPDYF